ncbi:MAG: DUF2332 domain-containing protein [Nocardioidaceae bacterium]
MDIVTAMTTQARACAEQGSPMYADLLERVAADVESGGECAVFLKGHEDDSLPSALALRLLGSVHRLVLDGTASSLVPFYPTTGGRWEPDAGWHAFQQTLRLHADAVRSRLDQVPQTNEVGRSATLMGGLLHIVAEQGLPVRLHEMGASGGLNLLADQFCYRDDRGTVYGRADSPVRFIDAWRGRAVPEAEVRVVDRVGADIAPLDALTVDGRLTLTSYVWPDQSERLQRLRCALRVADEVSTEVRREGARDFVDGIELTEGTTTVLWHSFMWQYLTGEEQQHVAGRIAEVGAKATDTCGFGHLRLEPTRRTSRSEHEFLVVLRTWPDGAERILGTAAPHGVPTTWE